MTHRLKIGTHGVQLHGERDLEPLARRWVEIGLCAWPAEKTRFFFAARSCYALLRTAWHGNAVWVTSPAVLALVLHLGPYGWRQDHAQRLHHLDGLALAWPDRWGLHAYHGVAVPAWLIERPQAITLATIEQQRNAEVRRVMLERLGWRRYFDQCGAAVVDSIPMDHPVVALCGARLLRKELPGDEPRCTWRWSTRRLSAPTPKSTFARPAGCVMRRWPRAGFTGAAIGSCSAAVVSGFIEVFGSAYL